jgi:ribosome-binding factor A
MSRHRHPSSSDHAAGQRAYPRALRLNALLQEVLAEELERIADSDERLGLVTLTGVACAPDLRHATVFVASLTDAEREVLEEHRRGLQAAVAAQVRTRRVPTLRFEPDPAIALADRVDAALRRAHERDAALHRDEPPGAEATFGAAGGPRDPLDR